MVLVFRGTVDGDTASRVIEELPVCILLDEADEDGRIKILPVKVATDPRVEAARLALGLLDKLDCTLLGRTTN